VDRRLGRQRAGEQAQDGEPAEVRIDAGPHDLGQQWSRRVALTDLRVGAVQGLGLRDVDLDRRREAAGQHFEQFGEAEPGLRAHRKDRVERAAGDRRLEVVDEHIQPEVLTGEVAIEQRLVLAVVDDRLDQRAALLVEVGVRR
jgi:hypothetical protein